MAAKLRNQVQIKRYINKQIVGNHFLLNQVSKSCPVWTVVWAFACPPIYATKRTSPHCTPSISRRHQCLLSLLDTAFLTSSLSLSFSFSRHLILPAPTKRKLNATAQLQLYYSTQGPKTKLSASNAPIAPHTCM